ncbi:MAG TPA: IPT/TIG domain-containing protein [Solirubrobacteraceae bacterium]|nr:IPT/TIG domain-containing protein [Solirubrobacteraceae bacterium]
MIDQSLVRRGLRRSPTAALLLVALTATLLIAGASAASARSAARPAHALAALGRTKANAAVPATRTTGKAHWACPQGACEAIVEPRPAADAARGTSPGGGLSQGSGELGGFSPQDLESAYKIPTRGGETQTVAVVDAFGYPQAENDLAEYRARYGLPPCTKANGCFKKLNQDGHEFNFPPEEPGWDVEQALDLDMVSAACPSCHVLLVEADNEDPYPNDLAESVNTAVKAGATEVSNSYGLPDEYCVSDLECERFAADYSHPGVFITAASGDHGYDNFYSPFFGGSPLYPADLPTLSAIGGTSLFKADNARGWSERVWNEPGRSIGTGSGCSTVAFATKPSWQSDKGCPGRIDSDVSAVAAVETPVSVYASAEGGWVNVGGTSAGSPLIAGIVAHESESLRSLGAQGFYEGLVPLYDVTEGSNGTCTPPATHAYFCTGEVGYDGPTGLGTPNAGATPPTVTKVEPSTGPATGGTVVTITGTRMSGATAVTFGETPAKSFTVESETSITAEAPVGSGTVDVVVTTPEGPSDTSKADQFSYTPVGPAPTIKRIKPRKGPEEGGTLVTITGTNFTGALSVKFGEFRVKSFEVGLTGTTITTTTPPGFLLVDVTVTTLGGSTVISKKDHYRYQRPKKHR